jgi:high-affinity iron transporter
MFQGFGQAFVITLREGLEAFLIVAISLAYLRKRGRGELTKAVHWGIAAAIAVSAIGGYILYNAANQDKLEGPLALVAAVSVATLTVHMWRAGRRMKGEIEGHLRSSAERAGIGALTGVFLFTLFMVGREGMETALLLMQLRNTLYLVLGATAGILAAAGMSWLWSRYGHRVNLGLFFQVTAIFLFVFVVQLFIQGIHESSEQNYLPYSAAIHEATESWGPDSAFGHTLTYLLVLLPAGWLALRGLSSSSGAGSSGAASKTAGPTGVAQHSSLR